MPLSSPAGPLSTLDDVVTAARRGGPSPLEDLYPSPVLLIVAPNEGWTQVTQVKGDEKPGAPMAMLPTVVVKVERKRYSGDDPKISVGRAPICDVVLPFSALSKVHAYVQEESADNWLVSDAGSRNGTLVNGVRLASTQSARLKDGTTLRFGDVTARFVLPSSFWADVRRRLK
jgi:hypothetical protein